jgi:hypothetical protein
MVLSLCRLLDCPPAAVRAVVLTCVSLGALVGSTPSAGGEKTSAPQLHLDWPFMLTQLPAGTSLEKTDRVAGGMLRAAYGDGSRVLLVGPDRSVRVLSDGFCDACESDVSFDGSRILVAGKRTATDNWNIYETGIDGSSVRQITRDMGDCRSPAYLSTLYTIVSPRPWYQLAFVSNAAGTVNEQGPTRATHLYTCKLDSSAVRRLTFNLSSDMDPFLMSDGRLLFPSWQRSMLRRGTRGRIGLFAINIDGADCSLFAGEQTRRIWHMPCETTKGLVVFVEADCVAWDGSGQLAAVSMRRPLHSYRRITQEDHGLFHSPSPLPDGSLLVSRRPSDGSGTLGIYRLDPSSGKLELLFDDPRYHDIHAGIVHARPEPDGRSSVVTEKDPRGKLYCLNVYASDLRRREWMPPGTVKRLRVLEGIPSSEDDWPDCPTATAAPPGSEAGFTVNGLPPLAQRRILGEIDIEQDGSFNIEVPANTPIELQILDDNGMALRSCSWIWAKNHEPRGCIGCHEDEELTPENLFMDAFQRPSTPLGLPPDRRRTVDFRRDVMPIIETKCVACHRRGESKPRLDGGRQLAAHTGAAAHFNRDYETLLATDVAGGEIKYRYVHPGEARTSPLIWHLFGHNTCRPWDKAASTGKVKPIPPGKSDPLSTDERRTFVEWIDMGALWDGIAGPDGPSAVKKH